MAHVQGITAAFLLILVLSPSGWSSTPQEGTAARLRQARALRQRSQQSLAGAEAEYRAVLRQAPRNLEALRGLARVLRDRGSEEAALPYLREATARSGEGIDAARLAWALYRAGHWAEAADAFATARERGYREPETTRGAELAAVAARTALDRQGGDLNPAIPSNPSATTSTPLHGWQGAWRTLLNATGTIAEMVQRVLFALIALVLVGSASARIWGTLLGRAAPAEPEGIPLRRWRGLPIRNLNTGRRLARVRRVIYDPKLGRVVGFRTGGRWRWRVLPLSAVRGAGPAGLLAADPSLLVRGDQAGELGSLARTGTLPLGPGRRLKRVVSEDGKLLAFTRAHRLWIDGATGQVAFEISPSRFHDACRATLSALQIGPVDWIMGKLLDHGLMVLPGRVCARLRLPAGLIRSADRDVVIVSGEAEEWIERHFQNLEAETQARLSQLREGVARARPVVEAGVARARPVLEKARESGAVLARRSAEGVIRGGRTGVEALSRLHSARSSPATGEGVDSSQGESTAEQRPTGTG